MRAHAGANAHAHLDPTGPVEGIVRKPLLPASTGTGSEEERKIGEVDRALVSHFLFEILSHIHTAGKDLTPVSAFTVEFCKYYPFE